MKTNRRTFIRQGTQVLAAASLAGIFSEDLLAAPGPVTKMKVGFQVWTIKEKLIADFAGTLKMMAEMGYEEVEMCSPLGYTSSGFGPLNNMSGAEMRKIVEDNGLKCTSSHFNLGELRDNLDNRIEWAHGLGMKQMVLASFWLPKDAGVDDYRRAAAELNTIGEKTSKAGLQMVFHNHHMEFDTIKGELVYDALLDEFDPSLVKMQFQVAVVNIGYKAADYFRKYPGRFISAHLSDWSDKKKEQVPVGQGVVDWKEFFKAARTGGVQNIYVEMHPDTFEPSVKYLKG